MQEFLSVIRSSTLFSGISEQELTAMLACLGTKASRFPKDALLLRAGDTAESIGLVLSGSVLVEQEDVWGNRNILAKAGPGRCCCPKESLPALSLILSGMPIASKRARISFFFL